MRRVARVPGNSSGARTTPRSGMASTSRTRLANPFAQTLWQAAALNLASPAAKVSTNAQSASRCITPRGTTRGESQRLLAAKAARARARAEKGARDGDSQGSHSRQRSGSGRRARARQRNRLGRGARTLGRRQAMDPRAIQPMGGRSLRGGPPFGRSTRRPRCLSSARCPSSGTGRAIVMPAYARSRGVGSPRASRFPHQRGHRGRSCSTSFLGQRGETTDLRPTSRPWAGMP